MECLPVNGDDEYGLVKWISSSDTIVVDLQGQLQTIRYLGIHSPADNPEQQYLGPPAATQNASLVQGQVVRLVHDGSKSDSFGQRLRYVLVYDTGTFVNFELLRLGLAQAEVYSPPLACQDTFLQAQQLAQQAQVGLWAPTPTHVPTSTPQPTLTNTPSPTTTILPTPTGTPPTSTPGLSPTPTTTTRSPRPSNTLNPALSPTRTSTAGTPTLTFTPTRTVPCDDTGSYPSELCIPRFPPDIDCEDISYRSFPVKYPDKHNLDADNDGIGCEPDEF